MKCVLHTNNKNNPKELIVRRKFVPIKLISIGENQFLNAGTKLPYTTAKVIGLLTTSKVIGPPCIDEGLPPKYYYGVSRFEITTTDFLDSNIGNFYDGQYPPDILIDTVPNFWWYFVHPITDRFPVLIANGMLQELTEPTTLEFKQEGQCTPDQYFLWQGKLSADGDIQITFTPPN
ncbi:hypothetical protein AB832_04490 [Flavobacteriaceae bacterium (ex Bugula neritina AB1)]|nr:hypothetical protein AB832_04490 [Flavobacteriaceae bacterium (ex Bugula neritina AB1)]